MLSAVQLPSQLTYSGKNSYDVQQSCKVVNLDFKMRWETKSAGGVKMDPSGISVMTVQQGALSIYSKVVLFGTDIFFLVFMLPSLHQNVCLPKV